MTKLEFIARQLAKAQNKKFEHYVINRIWNLLNDTRVKFVTQQFVARPEGRALTDMFFPQLEIHIEVDEGFHKKQIDADKLREADIVNATGHQILRVDVTKDIEQINQYIDEIVVVIKNKINSLKDFKPWNLEMEQNSQTYIDQGYIDVKDNVAFKTMIDAANCFGLDIKPKGIWTGGAKHPIEPNTLIWFPKLYENKDWNNEMSDDEKIITEVSVAPEIFKNHLDKVYKKEQFTRIVFPRFKSSLGDYMYRFKGKYQLDLEATSYANSFVWMRTAMRVQTYPNQQLQNSAAETKSTTKITKIYQRYIRQMSEPERLQLAALINEEILKENKF